MKQVKNLILAAFLVIALSSGVQAGDISSPGVSSTPPGDIGSPGAKSTEETVELNSTSTSEMTDGISDPVMMEILLALIALI